MIASYTVSNNLRVLEYRKVMEHGERLWQEGPTIFVELPQQIVIKDSDHNECPDEPDHICETVILTETADTFRDPVYHCTNCGEGPTLANFPGEPDMMIGHIEQCLGVTIVESEDGDQVRICFQAAQ